MTTCVRFCLSYDPFKSIFITLKVDNISTKSLKLSRKHQLCPKNMRRMIIWFYNLKNVNILLHYTTSNMSHDKNVSVLFSKNQRLPKIKDLLKIKDNCHLTFFSLFWNLFIPWIVRLRCYDSSTVQRKDEDAHRTIQKFSHS